MMKWLNGISKEVSFTKEVVAGFKHWIFYPKKIRFLLLGKRAKPQGATNKSKNISSEYLWIHAIIWYFFLQLKPWRSTNTKRGMQLNFLIFYVGTCVWFRHCLVGSLIDGHGYHLRKSNFLCIKLNYLFVSFYYNFKNNSITN